MSNVIKTKLTKTVSKSLIFYKLNVLFKTINKLENYFRYKKPVPETVRSNPVYKFLCGNCILHRQNLNTYENKSFRAPTCSAKNKKRVKGTLSK